MLASPGPGERELQLDTDNNNGRLPKTVHGHWDGVSYEYGQDACADGVGIVCFGRDGCRRIMS